MGGIQSKQRRASVIGLGIPALAVLLATTACAQPRLDRVAKELARSIPQSGDAVVSGSILVRLTDLDVKGAPAGQLGDLGKLPSFPLAAAQFVVQPGRERAAIVGPNEEVVGLAGPRVMYAKRKLNGPADKRPWVRLELERLDDIEVPRLEALRNDQNAGAIAVISPQFVLDLLRGVLTGSVKTRPVDGGGKTVEFNTSIDKANRELRKSEDERDDRQRLLRSLAITGDIFKGVAQLRADGTLRALQLELKERPDRRTQLKILVDLDMDKGPKNAISLDAPGRDISIRVGSLAALRTNINDRLSPEKVADLPAGLPTDLPVDLPASITGATG